MIPFLTSTASHIITHSHISHLLLPILPLLSHFIILFPMNSSSQLPTPTIQPALHNDSTEFTTFPSHSLLVYFLLLFNSLAFQESQLVWLFVLLLAYVSVVPVFRKHTYLKQHNTFGFLVSSLDLK